MVETPIYDVLVGELGDALADDRALFGLHEVDAAAREATADQSETPARQEAAAA